MIHSITTSLTRPFYLALLTCGLTFSFTATAGEAKVYFIQPADGDVVSSPMTIQFGLTGMGIAPAGVEQINTGHHHLLINVDELPLAGHPIPADANHIHFGGGQTEATIDLEPGEHRLQLLLGDHLHRPHGIPVKSEQITITVE